MAGGTDEDFEQALDEDLTWRKVELQSLCAQLERAASAGKDSPATRALSRSFTILLYAHWEGYTKFAFERYVRLLALRKPPVCEASDGLVVSHVTQLAGRVGKGDPAARNEMVELVRGATRPRLSLQRDLVNTRSNLRFEVLNALFETFGVPIDEFQTKRNLIDIKLCNRRNEIAHGRGNFPSVEDVLELHEKVLELLESVRHMLIRGVRMQSYRVQSVATAKIIRSTDPVEVREPLRPGKDGSGLGA